MAAIFLGHEEAEILGKEIKERPREKLMRWQETGRTLASISLVPTLLPGRTSALVFKGTHPGVCMVSALSCLRQLKILLLATVRTLTHYQN